jgi:DNA-binding transcriptional MerR regulator
VAARGQWRRSVDILILSYNTVTMENGRRYTIAELADASAAALDALGIAARNGQVRDRPDVRTIRYYGTLGLVDRPAEMTGRTALYGDRHLLQVLAVKALQARGATLADVQRTLVGASEPELRAAVGPRLPGALAAAGPPPARPGRAFWRTPPGPAAPAPAAASLSAGPAAVPGPARPGDKPADGEPSATMAAPAFAVPAAGRARLADDTMRSRLLVSVPLADGATLLIEHADGGAVDPGALRAAAAPLLTYLTDAGLLPGGPTHPGAAS